jgi:hypothetical protein
MKSPLLALLILIFSGIETTARATAYWVFLSEEGNPTEVRENLANVGKIRTYSRWLRAFSVEVQRESVAGLKSVNGVSQVRPFPHGRLWETEEQEPQDLFQRDSFYGPSWSQNNMLGITDLHQQGWDGSGVRICIIDTGFKLDHDALQSVNVVAAWDFINSDADPGPQAGDPTGQELNGTRSLGVIAGYAPGWLVGPAYGAEYCLAKTEMVDTEEQIEEDYWVAAMEWADSLGADIIVSGLNYYAWYTPEDLDGQTAVITLAANEAAQRGILVVNSTGNTGDNSFQYIAPPADAFGILSVGSVDTSRTLSSFSGRGPTVDGRIKPELVAPGQHCYTVNPYTTNYYYRADGTGYSAMLTAGLAALVWQAKPQWSAAQLRSALLATADGAAAPDSAFGWGVPQGDVCLQMDYNTPLVLKIDFSGENPYLHWQPLPGQWTYRVLGSEAPYGTFTEITTTSDSLYWLSDPINEQYFRVTYEY